MKNQILMIVHLVFSAFFVGLGTNCAFEGSVCAAPLEKDILFNTYSDYRPKFFSKNLEKKTIRFSLNIKSFQAVEMDGGRKNWRLVSHVQNVLRAKLKHESHFYIDHYRLVSKPINWDEEKNKIKLKITVFQGFGKNREVEEILGSMIVEGEVDGTNNRYHFKGYKTKKIVTKFAVPLVQLTVSTPPAILRENPQIVRKLQ